MRKLMFRSAMWSLMVAVMAVAMACTNDDVKPNEGKNPTVELTVVSVDTTEAELSLTSSDATEAWVYYAEESVAVDEAKVIAEGESVAVNGNVTLEELTPATKYVAYAVVKGAGGKTVTAQEAFTTKAAEEVPFEGYEFDKLVSAVYRTDNEAVAGNYEVTFGNTTDMAWEGDIQVFIDFYNEQDSDPINPVLPSGTYEPNTDFSAFSYSPSSSYVDIIVDGGELVSSPIMGTVTVERTGPTYTITVVGTLMLLDDMEFSARYTGTLQFVQGGTSAYEFFDEDFVVTAKDAQMRYWGGWFYPFADDVGIEMFDGTFDENGSMTRGYYVHLSRVFMPKYEDYNAENVPLADGIYEVYTKEIPSAQYCQPYVIEPGSMEDLFGDKHFVGSYITYVDNDTKKIALINSGTMTVERSGANYVIEADFVAENGVKVTLSYEGELLVGNFNDNDESMFERPYSTLTEDHVYNMPAEATYYAACLGEYMKPGYDLWFLTIYGANNTYPDGYGDMFTAEFVVERGGSRDELPTGTYTISLEVKDHAMFPGIVDFAGSILFTWYGDLTPDADGYSSETAPITSGTVVIEDAGEGKHRFVFDLVDDADNKITGEWTGSGLAEDLSSAIEASATPLALAKPLAR